MTNLLDILNSLESINKDKKRNYVLILDYLCFRLGIKKTEFFCSSNQMNILKQIEEEHLKDDGIGKLYEEVFEEKISSFEDLNEEINSKINFKIENGKIKSIFVSKTETGRLLLKLNKEYSNIPIRACEKDKLFYKISLINISFNKIPCKIINYSNKKNSNICLTPIFKKIDNNVWVRTNF